MFRSQKEGALYIGKHLTALRAAHKLFISNRKLPEKRSRSSGENYESNDGEVTDALEGLHGDDILDLVAEASNQVKRGSGRSAKAAKAKAQPGARSQVAEMEASEEQMNAVQLQLTC